MAKNNKKARQEFRDYLNRRKVAAMHLIRWLFGFPTVESRITLQNRCLYNEKLRRKRYVNPEESKISTRLNNKPPRKQLEP